MFEKYLEDLESRIDDADEKELYQSWADFLNNKFNGDLFRPKRKRSAAPNIEWSNIFINDTLNSYELMALSQLKQCSDILQMQSGYLLAVRSNYGTGILPSVFGAELFIMDQKMNTLPTSRPIQGGFKVIQKLLNKGIPDLNNGLGQQVFEMGQMFSDMLKDYPKCRKHIHIYHPDLQGPVDVCELLLGSDIFIEVYDEPELIKELLSLITETYRRFMDKWLIIIPPEDDGFSVHWGMLLKGLIMLRDDSAMNFSPVMYDEFIKPYDEFLLNNYSGAMHFCGKGDHYINSLSDIKGLTAINLSQPHYNNMNVIYNATIDKGIKILSLYKDAAVQGLKERGTLNSCVHVS